MKRAIFLVLLILSVSVATEASATEALCLNCGATHFGALVTCVKCGFDPMPAAQQNFNVLMALLLFSDHHLSSNTLKNFGTVVKKLKPVFPDFEYRLWALIYYVKETYPDAGLLDPAKTRFHPGVEEDISRKIRGLDLPVFPIEPGRMGSNKQPQ